MNKSFKSNKSRRGSPFPGKEENEPTITKKKKILIHGQLLVHIKEAKGRNSIIYIVY